MELRDLPGLNAILNGTSALLLAIGWWLIRHGKRAAHRKAMIAAFSVSVLFLISYLIYHSQAGAVRYQKTGLIRTVYFSVLISHTVLAAFVPFMAILSLVRGLQGRYEQHRAIARKTAQIWLYVSVTGVIVYWMLYRM